MVSPQQNRWRLDRRVDLSVLLQVLTLASLIVGSWINIQRQLDELQRDVTMLLDTQKSNTAKLDAVSAQALGHEYRLQAVERRFAQPDTSAF